MKPEKLDPPIDLDQDHVLRPPDAELTLVEYGSYACPHCHAVHEVIEGLRSRFGERMRYVFRHLPVAGSADATRASELGEDAAHEPAFAAAQARVLEDVESAQRSGARVTPTLFINGRRYAGTWDESSLADALLEAPGAPRHLDRIFCFRLL